MVSTEAKIDAAKGDENDNLEEKHLEVLEITYLSIATMPL